MPLTLRPLSALLWATLASTAVGSPNALDFDGADDRIVTGVVSNGDAITVEVWAHARAVQDPFSGQIYNGNGAGNGSGGPHVVLEILASGEPQGRMFNGTMSVGVVTGPGVANGPWVHLAYVYDRPGNRAELFVNGVSAGSATAPDPVAHTSSRWIGTHPIEARHFNGSLDEFRLWGSARTAEQVSAHMHCSLTGQESGLLLYYPFDQGSPGADNSGVTLAIDLAPGAHDGALAGFALQGPTSNWISSTAGVGASCTAWTAFCFGDAVPSICPCGNAGLRERGCDNSAMTGGALCTASGSTVPDLLVLTQQGELPTALSIFLQGNVQLSVPVTFGDGLRCVGGSLKRLYVKNAVGGVVSAPQSGDPSITSRSRSLGDPIALGTTRYYQIYYRDPDLIFCAAPQGDGFNVGNALRVLW